MTTDNRSRDRDSDMTFIIMILIALILSSALPALILGLLLFAWLRRATPGDPERHIFVVFLAIVGVGVVYFFREAYPMILPELHHIRQTRNWDALWPFLKAVWILTLPVAPWLALAYNALRPRSMDERLHEQDALTEAKERRQRSKAQRTAAKAPEVVGNDIVLGAVSGGDLQQWQHKQWLTYPARELSQHAVAIGASGSGKTETLLRIAALAAQEYGWQVIYLDAKGEEKTAARFLAAMADTGRTAVPLFPIRWYDGWRGDARAIVNRLHALQTFSEPYYSDVAMQVLTLAVNAPGGIPRSSAELVRRLGLDVLRELYQGHADAYKVERLRGEDVRGVYQRYAGFFDALDGKLDGSWSLEDVEGAYFLIQGTAFKREAASLGRFLVEDIAHYVTERKRRDRQVLIIIDEFSALSMSSDAANLFERLRSFGGAVIVSSQSYAGLGENAERLLGAATTIILHSCSDPERIGRRAGTLRGADYSYQLDRQGTPGRMTLRTAEIPRIDPNAVRQFGVGEAFVIAHGRAARVQVAPLGIADGDGWGWIGTGGIIPFPIPWPMKEFPAVTLPPRRSVAQATAQPPTPGANAKPAAPKPTASTAPTAAQPTLAIVPPSADMDQEDRPRF